MELNRPTRNSGYGGSLADRAQHFLQSEAHSPVTAIAAKL